MKIPACINELDLKPAGQTLLAICDNVRFEKGVPMTAVSLTKIGKLTLHYGQHFVDATSSGRVELLEHEAHHVAGSYFSRMKGRDPELWNVAFDCVINEHLDREALPEDGCFFDNMNLPPMSAEAAYDRLKNRQGNQGKGCGSKGIDLKDLPISKLPALMDLARKVMGPAGAHEGGGGDIDLPPVVEYPQWMKDLERHLKQKCARVRKHTWLRESRSVDTVRGRRHQNRRDTLGGLILLDTSGSMWGDLPLLIALIQKYLPKADGAVWDTVCSPRGPANTILKRTQDVGGGGTDPRCAAHLRKDGETTVWITDGYVTEWPEMSKDDVVVLTQSGSEPQGAGTVIRCDS